MKLITILSIILLSLFTNPAEELNGKWKLTRIEVSDKVLIPNKIDCFLIISSDKLEYNLAINNCWIDDVIISDDSIKYEFVACTLICCDERLDSISNYISYNGRYEISGSILAIENSEGTYYLVKQ